MSEDRDHGGVEGTWPETIEQAVARNAGDPPTDVVFDVLSRRHRRFVLYCLHREGEAMDLPQLVDSVVRLAERSRVSESPSHDSVAAQLVHNALPRLADAGIVVHDRQAGVVWPTDAVDAMEPLLDLAADLDFESEPPAISPSVTE